MKNIKGIILSVGLITTTVFTSTVFAQDKFKIDTKAGSKYDDISPFHDGRARVGIYEEGVKSPMPTKWGYINEKGEEVIPLQYMEAENFDNGVAMVREKGENSWESFNGFIDTNGNEVIPFKYKSLRNYGDGIIGFSSDGKWGYLDIDGNIIIDNVYEEAFGFHNGVATVRKDGKWGLIDITGKVCIPFEYEFLMEDDTIVESGFFRAGKDGKSGIINKDNEIIIPLKYDNVIYIGENMAKVGVRDTATDTWKWGIVNGNGEEIVPIELNYFDYYKNGLLGLKENGRYGARDMDGNIIMPFEYGYVAYEEDSSDSKNAIMIARDYDDGTVSYLDKNGQVVKTEYSDCDSFSEGLIAVKKGEKYGYVDFDFNVVIEPVYESAYRFSEGLAIAGNFIEGQNMELLYGYIDKTGEVIVPMQYDIATDFQNGQAIVRQNGEWFFISLVDESDENVPDVSDVPEVSEVPDVTDVSDIPKVILNGELLEFPSDPVIIEGTTYVPIRKIAEGLGATVTFEPNTKNTLVELNENVLSFNKSNNAIIKDDTMLIPVRYVSESFGAEVLWEQSTKTVTVNQKHDVLLNSLNDEVFLYANSSETGDGIYNSILVKTKDKEEIFNWKCTTNETFYPAIEYLDDDKIFISMTEATGTGVHVEKAHILNKNTLEEYEVEDPIKILDEKITIYDNETIDGKTYVSIDAPYGNFKYEIETDSNTFNKASYGSMVKFNIVDGTLVSNIGVNYSLANVLNNNVDIYYKFHEGKYVYDKIIVDYIVFSEE